MVAERISQITELDTESSVAADEVGIEEGDIDIEDASEYSPGSDYWSDWWDPDDDGGIALDEFYALVRYIEECTSGVVELEVGARDDIACDVPSSSTS